jgi:hypothetical protein
MLSRFDFVPHVKFMEERNPRKVVDIHKCEFLCDEWELASQKTLNLVKDFTNLAH